MLVKWIEGSPNHHKRYFGRAAYLALEGAVRHEVGSGSKNQAPTLSLPGIRLHLTLRALQGEEGGGGRVMSGVGNGGEDRGPAGITSGVLLPWRR